MKSPKNQFLITGVNRLEISRFKKRAQLEKIKFSTPIPAHPHGLAIDTCQGPRGGGMGIDFALIFFLCYLESLLLHCIEQYKKIYLKKEKGQGPMEMYRCSVCGYSGYSGHGEER